MTFHETRTVSTRISARESFRVRNNCCALIDFPAKVGHFAEFATTRPMGGTDAFEPWSMARNNWHIGAIGGARVYTLLSASIPHDREATKGMRGPIIAESRNSAWRALARGTRGDDATPPRAAKEPKRIVLFARGVVLRALRRRRSPEAAVTLGSGAGGYRGLASWNNSDQYSRLSLSICTYVVTHVFHLTRVVQCMKLLGLFDGYSWYHSFGILFWG